MVSELRYYWAALANCPSIGNQSLQKLKKYFEDPRLIWQLNTNDLAAADLLSAKRAQTLTAFCKQNKYLAEKIFTTCQKLQIKVCSIDDSCYPKILQEIYNPPIILYYKGQLETEALRVAIVGSRRFTPYGEGLAGEFASALAKAGITVVSGAARGIDTFAHRGALKAGRTVAVLGCGLDVSYPPENRQLLANIAASGGAIISEYGPGIKPLPAFFPARNRIISGLSRGTLVVEAAKHSGSLITAEMAINEGRDVFAIPGSIYAKSSQGCNHLIQQGAKLVQQPADIIEEYLLPAENNKEKTVPQVALSLEERALYQVLSYDHPLSIDEIMLSLADADVANIAFLLLQMELKGVVIENEMHAYRRAERV